MAPLEHTSGVRRRDEDEEILQGWHVVLVHRVVHQKMLLCTCWCP